MDAATPPQSPLVGSGFSYINGYARENENNNTNGNRSSWVGSQDSSVSDRQSYVRPRYPHIKDLREKAYAELNVSEDSSINTLLERAQQSAKKADTDITFKRLDRAYIEWRISSYILLELVPRHRSYPDLNRNRGDQLMRYRALYKQNDAQHSQFREIHNMIVEDNSRSGIIPCSSGHTSGTTLRASAANGLPSSPRPLSMPEHLDLYDSESGAQKGTSHQTTGLPQRHSPSRPSSQPARERPPVRTKPDRLHALQQPKLVNNPPISLTSEILSERFAKLRAPVGHLRAPLPYPDDTDSRPPEDQHSQSMRPHISQPEPGPINQSSKPSGPRVMPLSSLPPLPPKIPLDTRIVTLLPRAPSPTYSPARNIQDPPSVIPPRNTIRSLSSGSSAIAFLPTQSSPSYTSSYPTTEFEDTNISTSREQARVNPPARSEFQELPNSSAISAKELYDRLRQSNILLIDVRSREEYDGGHILAKSIICIEPLSLRLGTSAEDLEDRLVVSPESEEILFKRRDEFDLVVYYDQDTSSNRFLEGPPNRSTSPALRALSESLWEFNYNRQLQRHPVVLLGGLEAWIDLVGSHALQPSKTAMLKDVSRLKVAPNGVAPRGRASTITANSSREVQRRRLREYNPLDADEERIWLEKAKQEQVEPAEYQTQSDGDTDSASSRTEEPPSPLIHSYEDFLRRFPEASSMQQSMVGFRQAPPSRPAPVIPAIPSRPPPAVPRPSYSGVRDSGQLSPTSRQPAAAQTPLYTSRSITHYLKLPRTGLINFGVTCYMNATIQCLLAIIPLSQFFLDNRWRDFTQKNWKGSNGIMPEIYANLIRSLWKNDVQSVRPSSLRNFCTRLNREWGMDRQQDAKEFLEFIIDCLHEDLNVNWNRHPLRALTPDEELRRERMPVAQVSRREWDRYSHREASFISDLFAGQHASRLRCTTCSNTSTTWEAFYSISVEIPRSGRGDIRDCLRSYCQEEMLSGDEVWKCPYCKCEREATKRITLTRLPKILVIHFKRFSASKTESARKVHTPIDFPLHGLKMEPYMADTQADLAIVDDGFYDPAITPPFQYDAYAVMRHLGQTGNGGHYISLVRDAARGLWRKFDDERAAEFDPTKLRSDQSLQNGQAYIVFYGRSAAR